MHVLLFFLAVLIAGAVTGLAYVLSSLWWLAVFAGLGALWITEGLFERCFGYQPAQRWAGRNNLPAH
jgi:hypothetical protein